MQGRDPRNVFIVAFLALQIALPLTYYAGDDLFDERFAWRMFSPIRVVQCQLGFTEEQDGVSRQVPLGAEVGIAWIGLMRRARIGVIEGWAEHRCDEMRRDTRSPVLRVDLQCGHPDGEIRRPVDPARNLCDSP